MKFEVKHKIIDIDDGYDAADFLEKCFKENTVHEIENIDEVFDIINCCLWIGENAQSKLKEFHNEF